MPRAYEKMRDKFAKEMPMKMAKTKAAKIYNSKHKTPVTHEEKEFIGKMKGHKR